MVKEKVEDFRGKAKEFFSKMTKKTKTLLLAVLCVIVVGAIVIAVVLNNRPYSVLFTGLGSEEVSSIITYLNNNAVTDYKIKGNDTILVPTAQEDLLKADLLMQGYPKSGFLYETYRSGVNGMSTDADRKVAERQDLQDRMAGVIRCFEGVRNAVVTIAEGEDHRYVLNDDDLLEAEATVFVELESGGKLSDQQVTAIRNMVAHAVQGLTFDNVYISDSFGNNYVNGDDTAAASDATALKLQLENQVNNQIRSQIMVALSPFFGEDNLRVAVNSVVNIDRTVGESTRYTEPSWAADGSTGGEGIIGTKIYDRELIKGDVQAPGGVVGNQANADINNYVDNNAQVGQDDNYVHSSGENHYLVDTDKEQTERIAGYITDLSVSVSINSSTSGSIDVEEMRTHVAYAAGITGDAEEQAARISIVARPFYTEPVEPGPLDNLGLALPPWAIYAAIGGVVLLLLLLLLILLLRKRRRKRKEAEMERIMNSMPQVTPEGETVLIPEGGADIMDVKTERSIMLRQEIRKMADENPEMAARLLKNWLNGDGENG